MATNFKTFSEIETGVSIWHFESTGEVSIPTHSLADRTDFVTSFRILVNGRYLSLHVQGQATPTLLALVSTVKTFDGSAPRVEFRTTSWGKVQKQLGGDWQVLTSSPSITTFDPTTGRSRTATVSL